MSARPAPPAAEPAVTDGKALRRAFGEFASGVTVVTTGGPVPRGMTANSFTAVSLNPPLLLICVKHEATMHRSLESASHFGVSVLSDRQEAVARHFADHSRPSGLSQFASVPWTPGRAADGAPLIDGALARFECALVERYEGGDHTVFLGEVLSLERGTESGGTESDGALVFFQGRFRRLADETEAA
ncbi:flavin reductase family protein [Streptomyces inusitatus]|uniref:flavin reductase family protein n=1 Tax=Streptomyces inusitatus TaxID=68221 RepID=UPI00167F1481|nr:flavin reductase family protein [Streptomyces inusitatus]